MFLLLFFTLLVAGVAADNCPCPENINLFPVDFERMSYWTKWRTGMLGMFQYHMYFTAVKAVKLSGCRLQLQSVNAENFPKAELASMLIRTADEKKDFAKTVTLANQDWPIFYCSNYGKWVYDQAPITEALSLQLVKRV